MSTHLAGAGCIAGEVPVLMYHSITTGVAPAALPVRRKHGFRATLYVPTAYVGATARPREGRSTP